MQQLASTKKNTKNATIKSLFLALALALAWSTAISASPLTELKASGLIGERMDGYLGVVQTDAPKDVHAQVCLLYTSPSPRDRTRSRMPSSA